MDGQNTSEPLNLFDLATFEHDLAIQTLFADDDVAQGETIASYSKDLISNLGGTPDTELHRVAQRARRVGFLAIGVDFDDNHEAVVAAFNATQADPQWQQIEKLANQRLAAIPELDMFLQTITPDLRITRDHTQGYIAHIITAITVLQIQQWRQQEVAKAAEAERQRVAKMAETEKRQTQEQFASILAANAISLPDSAQSTTEAPRAVPSDTDHARNPAEATAPHDPITAAEYTTVTEEAQEVLHTVSRKLGETGYIPETTIEMLRLFNIPVPEVSTVELCEQARALAYFLEGNDLYEDDSAVQEFYSRYPAPDDEWHIYASECVAEVGSDEVTSEALEDLLELLSPNNEDEHAFIHSMACITLAQIWALEASQASAAKHRQPNIAPGDRKTNQTPDTKIPDQKRPDTPPEDPHFLPFQD